MPLPFLSNSPQETYALLPDGDRESLEFEENPKHGGSTYPVSSSSCFTSLWHILFILATETVIGAFGRAGWQSYYGRNMVNSIGFVIFDSATATSRIAGVRSRH